LRRLCQNVCIDKKIPEPRDGGLKARIRGLAEQGFITKSLADMADTIRVVGNELAHPSPESPLVITPDDVDAAWDFAVQLVNAVYVGPARADKFKSKLAEKGVK
jgi:hypothetical protein